MERLITAAVTAAALLALAVPLRVIAAPLLANGGLLEGSGDTPVGWRPDAWSADASQFGWEVNADADRGTLAVTNLAANDARWCQTVAVIQGSTYRISAEVKTQNVGTNAAGAFISVEPRIAHSRLLDGTRDWQPLELLVEATGPEQQWDICLRLGSNGSLNTGSAWFRSIAMVLIRAGSSERSGPSPLTVVAQWVRQTGWIAAMLPLVAGLVLAFGFGMFDRRTGPHV